MSRDKSCLERIKGSFKNRVKDFKRFMNNLDNEEILQEFYQYGLSFDLIEVGTFEDQARPYYRYQISWGGPSDELRFYESGKVVYAFLDWFDGATIDVTNNEVITWLKEDLEEMGSIDWNRDLDMALYYND